MIEELCLLWSDGSSYQTYRVTGETKRCWIIGDENYKVFKHNLKSTYGGYQFALPAEAEKRKCHAQKRNRLLEAVYGHINTMPVKDLEKLARMLGVET